jgi:hypothetical protein
MSDIIDVVKALTEVSSALRSAANNAALRPPEDDHSGYYDGKVTAYHDAAGMVDAVMVGPAIQAALDRLDAEPDVASDVTVIDQTAAVKLIDQLTDNDRNVR